MPDLIVPNICFHTQKRLTTLKNFQVLLYGVYMHVILCTRKPLRMHVVCMRALNLSSPEWNTTCSMVCFG